LNRALSHAICAAAESAYPVSKDKMLKTRTPFVYLIEPKGLVVEGAVRVRPSTSATIIRAYNDAFKAHNLAKMDFFLGD
jgi:hypothetical protein